MATDVTHAPPPDAELLASLADPAVALAQEWIAATERDRTADERETSGQLAALVGDPAGLDLAVRFVDRVARPEDPAVAADELTGLSTAAADAAGFLARTDRLLLRVGARVAPLAPRLVVPLARRRLRQLVGHLVVDAHDPALRRHLERARAAGFRLNINLLGEAVLGEDEAARRTERTRRLLARGDVDYVSIKVSSLVSQISPWDVDGTVDRVVDRLRPLYETALAADPRKFVNLDMEEYRDLDLTVAVFTALLDEPALRDLEAGIVLQAYLPDSVAAFEGLADFAARRVAAGGAGVKVRFVKGANLSMEHTDAELHGWTPAPFATKAETDANYLRLVERALRPELEGVVRIGVASHNTYDLALAHLLAWRRGLTGMLDIEMLQGMAPAQARAVRDAVGSVLLYTPVVAPDDFDVAVSYLIRRLEENAEPQNFLHALFTAGPHEPAGPGDRVDGDGDPRGAAPDDQEDRFRASVAAVGATGVTPRRVPTRPAPPERFANTADTDPALPAARAWAAAHVALGLPETTSPLLGSTHEVDAAVGAARSAQADWAARPAAERAAVLRRVGDELEARRGDLVAVMASEAGKTVAESDPEVSEAVDFARYYADRARELDPTAGDLATDGARFTPDTVTLVTPPWNFPVAIPTGCVLGPLAAGSAVIIKPAHATVRCAEVAMGAVHAALLAAGAPPEVVQVVRTGEDEVGRALVAHPQVDTVLLTGSIETARMFSSWRARHPGGPRVFAETSGKNTLVITPAADYDLAVADLVRSAFGHAGQKCSAASLAVLVGSAGRSERLRRQLVDAVRSVRVGWPDDLGTTMGPLIEPPTGKLERALTTLDPGERWLVEPRRLDDSGRLWSPGLKEGVAPGSWFHRTECFGPVLGLMRADDLDEAVALQNTPAFGLTGGLHSLDEDEIDRWLATVEVGNAYVNRHITGAIVQRQPFGGWKDSVVGPGAKAGGPDYVAQMGTWRGEGLPARTAEPPAAVRDALAAYRVALVSPDDTAWLEAAIGSDALVWAEELGREIDRTGLAVEQNMLRYRPAPGLTVRAGPGASLAAAARVLLAAELVGCPAVVSLDPSLSAWRRVGHLDAHVDAVETTDELVARMRDGAVGGRVRAVGEGAADVAAGAADGTDVTVLAEPVLATGRRELLAVLRSQAVSRTLHRFGHLPRELA